MVLLAVVDAQRARAGDAGLAHAARDHRRVRGHAAARRQDAFGGVHAVNVFGRRLDPHQNDLAALGLELRGFIGGENTISPQAAPGEAGRPVAITLRSAFGSMVGCSSWSSEAGSIRSTASSLRDQLLIGELDRDPQRRLGGALAGARLQHPQLALLDGEFEVLHVAVMLLERVVDALQLGEGLRQRTFPSTACRSRLPCARCLGDFLRRADAGDDVLALRIDQEFAVELLLAGRRIAREGDAGRGRLAHIAEHHGLHVDRGAPAFRDVVQPAIGDGALRSSRSRTPRRSRPRAARADPAGTACRALPARAPCSARPASPSRRRSDRCRAM